MNLVVFMVLQNLYFSILDILNPTRKETTIENSRQNGNINGYLSGHI